MDHDPAGYNFADDAAGTAIFVIALSLIVLTFLALRERRRNALLVAFLERGREIPAELLPRQPSRHAEFRRGTWLTGFALGIGLALYAASGSLRTALWCLIPLCVGAASFINAWLFYPANGQQS